MPYNTDIIWAGTEIGIFETTDGGATWAYADNGFPAVAVWQMKIVNDQVVVATHGRGIWSVTLPELAGYEPVPIILSPVLNAAVQSPDGNLLLNFSLRSVFDSTYVIIDSQVVSTIFNDSRLDTVMKISYPVLKDTTLSVHLTSFKDGKLYKTSVKNITVMLISTPLASYSNDFES